MPKPFLAPVGFDLRAVGGPVPFPRRVPCFTEPLVFSKLLSKWEYCFLPLSFSFLLYSFLFVLYLS